METMETILDFLLTFLILGGMALIVALMSREREIGFWTLFAVSVFFTPFIGIIVAFLSKKKRNPNEIAPNQESEKFWARFMPGKNEEEIPSNPPSPRDGRGNNGVGDRVQPKNNRSKKTGSGKGISV